MRPPRCISAISALLTDMFMCRAKDADDQLLIQHTVPVTGGMSGSPLIDKSGDVIGIISGGNTDNASEVIQRSDRSTSNAVGQDQCRDRRRSASRAPLWSISPSESICSKASRAARPIGKSPTIGAIGKSCRQEIHEVCSIALRTSSRTWPKSITSWLTPTGKRESAERARSSRAGADRLIRNSQGHSLILAPGHVYGFIANSKSGLPIAINVKRSSAPRTSRGSSGTRSSPRKPRS